MAKKVVEFEKVYLEFPEELENVAPEEEKVEVEEKIFKTTKLSIEELQKRLEETQTLHL